jgi:hypothetical protein
MLRKSAEIQTKAVRRTVTDICKRPVPEICSGALRVTGEPTAAKAETGTGPLRQLHL